MKQSGRMLRILWIGGFTAALVLLTRAPTRAQGVTLNGTATQGTGMSGATVIAYAVDLATGANATALGSSITDNNGDFTVALATTPAGPVRIIAHGGSFVSVEDGATITSPGDVSVLYDAMTGSLAGISINPLTQFVSSVAVGRWARGPAAALSAATARVEQIYGLKTDPSTLVPDYTVAGIGTDAGILGLILGALINEDEHLCAPPRQSGRLVSALTRDLQDGVFDGKNFGTPLTYCGVTLPTIAGTSDFQDALSGLQGLELITAGFAFGGPGNLLTTNGVTPDLLAASSIRINANVGRAVPPPVNRFAPPADTPTMKWASVQTASNLRETVLFSSGQLDGVTQIYHPPTNSFQFGPVTFPHAGATATLLPNGNVLIAGGNPVRSSELYDPANKSFTLGPAMVVNRIFHAATLLGNGKVLIVGGVIACSGDCGVPPTDTIVTELYDPVANSFTTGPALIQQLVAPTLSLMPDGKVLIAGGATNIPNFIPTNQTEIYDPVANTIAAGPPMNQARAGHSATALPNGKVLMTNGDTADDSELYDPIANAFVKGPPLGDFFGGDTALLPSGQVLITGGCTSACVSDTGLFNPVTVSITPGPPMNFARTGQTASLLPNGEVLVAGGNGLTTELYTP